LPEGGNIDKISGIIRISRPTFQKAEKIVEAAEQNTEKYQPII
jgi:hypothetical protein